MNKYIIPTPSVTYRRARNLKNILVKSYHEGTNMNNAFGSKGPKKGCSPSGKCVACANIEKSTSFSSSDESRKNDIRHYISCDTEGVIYCDTSPCNLKYIGLTTQKLKVRTREHILDIQHYLLILCSAFLAQVTHIFPYRS